MAAWEYCAILKEKMRNGRPAFRRVQTKTLEEAEVIAKKRYGPENILRVVKAKSFRYI